MHYNFSKKGFIWLYHADSKRTCYFQLKNSWPSQISNSFVNKCVSTLFTRANFNDYWSMFLQISTGGNSKPAFAIDCGIHADEWIGPATCIHFAKFVSEEATTLFHLCGKCPAKMQINLNVLAASGQHRQW